MTFITATHIGRKQLQQYFFASKYFKECYGDRGDSSSG